MQVKSKDGTFRELRGRIGNFIFRTRNGKIFAFYKPVDGRSNPDPIPVQLREIAKFFHFIIIDKNERTRTMTTQEIHQRLEHRAGRHIPIKHLLILMECFGEPVTDANIEAFLRYAW